MYLHSILRGLLILQTLLQRAFWTHSLEFASTFITLPIGLNCFQESGSFHNSRGIHGSRTPKRTILRLSWIESKLRLHRWRLYIWPFKPCLVFKQPTTVLGVSKFNVLYPLPMSTILSSPFTFHSVVDFAMIVLRGIISPSTLPIR